MPASAPVLSMDTLSLEEWRSRCLSAEACLLALEARAMAAEARADAAETRADAAEARLTTLETTHTQDVAALTAQVREMQARLNTDSTNSSKPPSSDTDPARSRRLRNRTRSGTEKKPKRSRGGQPGHKGHHRKMLPHSEVDAVVPHYPDQCRGCGHTLTPENARGKPQRVQQWEIPPVRPTVTEHQCFRSTCPGCGTRTRAEMPADVKASAFGPRILALTTLLVGRFHLSRRSAAELLATAFGLPLSAATVQTICMRLSAALEAPTEELVEQLPGAQALNLDETGWRQNGIRHWLWVAVASTFVVFAIHRRRSRAQPMSWLTKGFLGTVMSDRWSAYRFLGAEKRQLCWAHLLRDLLAVVEAKGSGSERAQTMLEESWQMFHHWHAFESGQTTRKQMQEAVAGFRVSFHTFCETGSAQSQDKRWRALGRELVKLWPAVFHFVDEEGIAPTNNAAERAIRAGVLWRRISQGTRTNEGSLFVARILTAHATCKLQGRSLFDYLYQAASAWLGGDKAPSLLPATAVV